jgi:uncharacterized Zn finger protein
MAESKCPSCNSKDFEVQKKVIQNGSNKFEFTFVQCAKCGTVLGVLQTGILLSSIAVAANNVSDNLDKVKFDLKQAIHENKKI